jgi:putative transport protein
MAEFMREFGLILFVYTIGMQVGPGFFASLRHRGAALNALAALVVLLGTLLAVLAHVVVGIDVGAVAGMLAGATTNTPSLGAAQEALRSAVGTEAAATPGLAYAVAYPFGVVGIILGMLVLRVMLGLRVDKAEQDFLAEEEQQRPPLATLTLRVTNPNVQGVNLRDLPGLRGSGVVVSRIKRGGVVSVARPEDPLQPGDVVLAVGPSSGLEALRIVVGEACPEDLRSTSEEVSVRRIIVTRREAIGRSLDDLGVAPQNNVRFTRLTRAEVDLPDPMRLRLHAGDTLTVVGSEKDLDAVSSALGNSMKDLNHPQVIPIFVGIALGILLGSLPVLVPGIPSPVKLGLAGGPLVVAILLSHQGRLGPLVWYLPSNANFLLREIGIVMFLAVVGLKSGDRFVETLAAGNGFLWMACGAVITLLPLLVVGLIGLAIFKTNYLTLTGVLAGSMTDPPALAFANATTSTAAPALAYSTVYPLTMLLRVVAVQLLVLLLA